MKTGREWERQERERGVGVGVLKGETRCAQRRSICKEKTTTHLLQSLKVPHQPPSVFVGNDQVCARKREGAIHVGRLDRIAVPRYAKHAVARHFDDDGVRPLVPGGLWDDVVDASRALPSDSHHRAIPGFLYLRYMASN